MSTSYEITGQGARLTERRIRAIAEQIGGSVRVDPEDGHLIVQVGDYGWVHHYGGDPANPRSAWNGFERFGGNHEAAWQWVEFLNASGFSVRSEYD